MTPSNNAIAIAIATGALRDPPAQFSILFPSLFREGKALAFPCDAHGEVVMDGLSERARRNYFYARAMIGRDYGWPSVQRAMG